MENPLGFIFLSNSIKIKDTDFSVSSHDWKSCGYKQMNSENSNLKSYRHKVGQNWYHVVLVTKYRNPVFRQDHQRKLMAEAINWVCPRHKIDVFKYEIMDEHVHLFISAPHKYSISKAIQIIKGATSYYIRRMHPPLRRYASF